MAHLHSVYDTDSHFSIDAITRAIKNESSKKVTVMQYDHNSERFTFELPKYIEGHDMSDCNLSEVHYQNGATKGLYVIDDLQISPDDDAVVICSWLISKNATQHAASLEFRLTFSCVSEEGKIEYAWSTGIHKGISVQGGICNSEVIDEEYPDAISYLNNRVDDLDRSSVLHVKQNLTEEQKAQARKNIGVENNGSGSGGNAENGEDGFSPIATVEQTDTGAVISITDKNGTTTATITNGKDGKDGNDGMHGFNGNDGSDGVSATHSWNGTVLTVTSASGTSSADLKGEPGVDGISPHVGSNGNWFIGENDTGIPATGPAGGQGLPGTPGEDGKDGTSATHSWNGTVLTISSASGTSSADLKGAKGDKGDKGDTGAQGIQGEPGQKGDKGDTGATGAAGYTPVRGTDYWTEADKNEIKAYVDEAILGGAW